LRAKEADDNEKQRETGLEGLEGRDVREKRRKWNLSRNLFGSMEGKEESKLGSCAVTGPASHGIHSHFNNVGAQTSH
jgi:hypothetical protein